MFPLTITTVDSILFDGEARSFTCHGEEGELTVLKSHEPLVTPLRKGDVCIRIDDKENEIVELEGGFLLVDARGATILVS